MAETTLKGFDCVEMKRRAQRELAAEYESRKGEFSSYWDFIRKTARESEWERAMIEKFSGARSRAQGASPAAPSLPACRR